MSKYLEMMDSSLRNLPAWVYVGVSLVVFAVALTWLLLPFAVFGTKSILREVLRKQKDILKELKELRLDQQDILYELRRLRNPHPLPNEQPGGEPQSLRDPSERDGSGPDHRRL